ncbi:hypothetical protein KQI84_02435 [bacterium]|nr:hypothetical protein [bacterium]
MSDFDVIVVGSGASAVHAAWPIVEAGLRVAMLDVGSTDKERVPAKDFLTLRKSDEEQHRYLLGERFEGVPFGPVRVGAQLTPPRQFITRDVERLTPLATDLHVMQSLALGGLGAGWGASTVPFNDRDIENWPIGRTDLQPHYEKVAARIGVCGTNHDDLAEFLGPVKGMLSPAKPDSNARSIFKRYRAHRAELNRRGFYMGIPRLALATHKFRGRGPVAYNDMEFWSDADRSVYRPKYTVEELQRFENFTYRDGCLVERFQENEGRSHVEVACTNTRTGARESFTARRLVIGAGAIGTARIVLRSLNRYDECVPFVCNPYTYFPCLNVARLGRPSIDRRHSLTQLLMVFDPSGENGKPLQPQLYSYRSLLLFKLVKESPLPVRESIRLMRLLQEYFVIVGVFHEDCPRSGQFARLLKKEDGDELELRGPTDPDQEAMRIAREKRLMPCLRRVGCLPLKRIDPGFGSSIHYGGTFPMSVEGDDLTTTPDGTLRAAPLVTLADGATFPHLPAKGLTFTLMANGNRIGEALVKNLQS